MPQTSTAMLLATFDWRISVTGTRTHIIYLSCQTTRVTNATVTHIVCRTISMLSHYLSPCLSTQLVINVAYSAALMEVADFLLNTHNFLPHYTVFLIIVPLRTSNLIT
jgi:hypothetical protein